MNGPFRLAGPRIRVDLSAAERAALASLPAMIDAAGDAGGRLDYQAHPDDPEAERRYRDLLGDALESSRSDDRRLFLDTVDDAGIDADTAGAWMRVMGEARLVLAQRLGIEEDGWEEGHDPTTSPEAALLAYLGFLQDALVDVLD